MATSSFVKIFSGEKTLHYMSENTRPKSERIFCDL